MIADEPPMASIGTTLAEHLRAHAAAGGMRRLDLSPPRARR